MFLFHGREHIPVDEPVAARQRIGLPRCDQRVIHIQPSITEMLPSCGNEWIQRLRFTTPRGEIASVAPGILLDRRAFRIFSERLVVSAGQAPCAARMPHNPFNNGA